jgi:hypothetical protein
MRCLSYEYTARSVPNNICRPQTCRPETCRPQTCRPDHVVQKYVVRKHVGHKLHLHLDWPRQPRSWQKLLVQNSTTIALHMASEVVSRREISQSINQCLYTTKAREISKTTT